MGLGSNGFGASHHGNDTGWPQLNSADKETQPMKKRAIPPFKTLSPFLAALSLTFVLMPIPVDTAQAQQSATEEEAYAIGVDAYLYFYPLLTMDITRKQSVNIEPGKELGKGPMNMFVSIPAYPPADP